MILSCGDALYDVFMGAGGTANRSSIGLDARVGGSPLNVAMALSRLGQKAGFFAKVSTDPFGQNLAAYEASRDAMVEAIPSLLAYLRAQLLTEPHRARMSDILIRYTDNRIALAKAQGQAQTALLRQNDQLVTDMWAATSAAFPTIQGLDFSSAYLDSVNQVIDLDTSRKTARAARVPAEVFVVLFIYLVTTAAVLGYVMHGARGRMFWNAYLSHRGAGFFDADDPLREDLVGEFGLRASPGFVPSLVARRSRGVVKRYSSRRARTKRGGEAPSAPGARSRTGSGEPSRMRSRNRRTHAGGTPRSSASSAANHICQSSRGWCGATNAGRLFTSPGFQRKASSCHC